MERPREKMQRGKRKEKKMEEDRRGEVEEQREKSLLSISLTEFKKLISQQKSGDKTGNKNFFELLTRLSAGSKKTVYQKTLDISLSSETEQSLPSVNTKTSRPKTQRQTQWKSEL